MRIIGLTGGTGSGKSHVGSMLKERHAYIADLMQDGTSD